MKKILLLLLCLSFPFLTFAQLTVPQGGTGQTSFPIGSLLSGNTTLRLVATGTPQLTVGNLLATSTTATSLFNGSVDFPNTNATTTFESNVLISTTKDSSFGFNAWNELNVIDNQAAGPVQINVVNRNTGVSGGSGIFLGNSNSTNGGFSSTYYDGLFMAGSGFGLYPGVLPNDMAVVTSDANLRFAALSTKLASSTMTWSVGPGFTSANYDMTLLSTLGGNGYLGISTSTPQWPLQVNSTTTPQLSLGDGVNKQWTFRNAGGILYIGTSSPTTFATTSTAALQIDANGKLIANCFSTDGSTCIVNGGSQTPWTANENATGFNLNNLGTLNTNSFNATSTTATSTIAASGLQLTSSIDTTYDNLLTIKPGRTYGSSSNASIKEGVVDIDGTSASRILLNIGQGSSAGAGCSPECVLIRQQSTSATGLLIKVQTAATGAAGNLMASFQGKNAPAIEFNEDIWSGGSVTAGAGLFEFDSHNNEWQVQSRNNANNAYCPDVTLSPNFSTTTSGTFTLFPCTNANGNYTNGTGRLNVFGTSTIANLLNLTSLTGSTEGNILVVKQAGNVGVGTTSPYANLSVQSGASTGDAFAVATTTGAAVFGIDNDGHTFTSGPTPTLSACGTGSPAITGDDQTGTITTGTAATSCTMTFSKAYRYTPVCNFNDDSSTIPGDISAISTSAVTFALGAGLNGGHLYYQCAYHKS